MQSIHELPFVAGHVALDFVNTAEERGHPDAGEAFRTPADLRLWGQRYGLLKPPIRADDEDAELQRALDARELLYALFLARVQNRRPARTYLDRLGAMVPSAYEAARLRLGSDGHPGWAWSPTRLDTVRHTVVVAAVELLAGTPQARLKQCPGEHCGWFFLDLTKRGNRRWCSMSECGQDAKTARRRARQTPHGSVGT